MLVAQGWYLTILAAVVVAELQVPGQPCNGRPWCVDQPDNAWLGLLLLSPFLFGLGVAGLMVAIPARLMTPSAPLAGTFTAGVGLVLAVGVAAVILWAL